MFQLQQYYYECISFRLINNITIRQFYSVELIDYWFVNSQIYQSICLSIHLYLCLCNEILIFLVSLIFNVTYAYFGFHVFFFLLLLLIFWMLLHLFVTVTHICTMIRSYIYAIYIFLYYRWTRKRFVLHGWYKNGYTGSVTLSIIAIIITIIVISIVITNIVTDTTIIIASNQNACLSVKVHLFNFYDLIKFLNFDLVCN